MEQLSTSKRRLHKSICFARGRQPTRGLITNKRLIYFCIHGFLFFRAPKDAMDSIVPSVSGHFSQFLHCLLTAALCIKRLEGCPGRNSSSNLNGYLMFPLCVGF
jgi:hypothetical protein